MMSARSDRGPSEWSFAELLSSHRGAAGLTQEELAHAAGLSVNAISLLERGVRGAPRPRTVARLAAALRLSADERRALAAAARRPSAVRQEERPLPADLRVSASRFVGRERELAEVRALLHRPHVRLLTLTGSPGTGKTRLALEAVRELDDSRDGVVPVALGSLADPTGIMRAVQQALGLVGARNQTPLDAVAAFCEDRQLLLLLDNFEHLVAAAPELTELLDRCPDLRLLVTSRAALRIRDETEFAVPPLGLPTTEQERAAGPAELAVVPAVALFVDRASALRSDFGLTTENAAAVAAVCRHLDGLPLALELAAPWVRLLTPRQILDQLRRRVDLLVGGSPGPPGRRRTMRETLAWSYELLEPAPGALLRRLSVFRGGAPLDALERVCQAAGALTGGVLPNLATLVDHSLVGRHESNGGEPRVTMLETVREYGRDLLVAAGEEDTTAFAHLEHYANLAARTHAKMRASQEPSELDRLGRELANVRAALGWAVERDLTEAGLRLASAMWPLWDLGGHRREGLSWLSDLLAAGSAVAPRVRGEALLTAGFLAWELGAHERSVTDLGEALAVFRVLRDTRDTAQALRGLGNAVATQGNHSEAIRFLEEAVTLLRDLNEPRLLSASLVSLGVSLARTGDRPSAIARYEEAMAIQRRIGNGLGTALCLINLGHQAQVAGDLALAGARLDEAVAIGRRLASPYHLAAALAHLGDVSREREEIRTARAHYRESLQLFARVVYKPGAAHSLRGLAWLAWREGQASRAATLYGAGAALCPVAVASDSDDVVFHRMVLEALSEQLGAEAFAAAHEAGGRLSLQEAAAAASATAPSKGRRPPAS